jgi:hypothetical protein
MKFISHRGNIDGPNPKLENTKHYIDEAIRLGYDVEVDVWYTDDVLYLGHDKPQYGVEFRWFRDRITKLWVHCKNIEVLLYFKDCGYPINYFWHEEDTITLTSNGSIWAYPGKQPIKDSIAVMPEIYNDNIYKCAGICSDKIEYYKNELK